MYRSMMQIFVKGSAGAVTFYQKAFASPLLCCYPALDGTIMHAELDVYGQTMAISELPDEEPCTGNAMMFCLHFGEGTEALVQSVYDALKIEAKSASPLAPCSYSPLEAVIIDRYGVRWCIFV